MSFNLKYVLEHLPGLKGGTFCIVEPIPAMFPLKRKSAGRSGIRTDPDVASLFGTSNLPDERRDALLYESSTRRVVDQLPAYV